MSPVVLRTPIEKLVQRIREITGNLVHSSRVHFLEEAALRRAHGRGYPDLASYVQALTAGAHAEEWGILVSLVTIKESYFFRAPQQFEAIVREVLPRLLRNRARSGERRLRVWSAACARGEEPATLALLLAEDKTLAGWDWTVLATDLDSEALAAARTGLYGERAVAQVPPELRQRYFSPRGKLFELSAHLRERIAYREVNLAHPPYDLPGAPFDLILLRNVLIYFRRSLQRRVVAQMAQLLAPDGDLFLGATETLWPAQGELVAVDLGSCFVYRKERPGGGERGEDGRRLERRVALETGGAAEGRREIGSAAIEPERAPVPLPPLPLSAFVEPAAFRVDSPPALPAGNRTSAGEGAPAAFAPSVDRPAATVAEAVRLLAADRLAEAETRLEAILDRTPSDAAAHALHGFLLDVQGRDDGAIGSYRAALYLDPALFQVRLLLAERLLRGGARGPAERQFREVLTLLASGREHPLAAFAELPIADREGAERRCRQALGGR